MAAAAVLSFIAMGERPGLWHPETHGISILRLDWAGFWHVLSEREANMALYYFILKLALPFGDSEIFFRSISIGFAVASFPFVYLIGKELFDRRAGLAACWMMAFNAFFIHFSHEVRSYSLLVLLALISTYCLILGIKRPNAKFWTFHSLTGVLLVYTQFFGALVLISQALFLLFLSRESVPWKRVFNSAAFIVLFLLPLAAFFLTKEAGQVDWVPEVHAGRIYNLFWTFSGAGSRILLLGYFVLTLTAVIHGCRIWKDKGGSPQAWGYALLLVWLFLPMTIAYLVSLKYPVFMPRYLIVSHPALVLLAGAGASRITNRWLFAGTLALVIALSIRGEFLPRTKVEVDWKSVAERILTSAKPGDGIIVYHGFSRAPFDFYARKVPSVQPPPAYIFPKNLSAEFLASDGAGALEEIPALPGPYKRIWLILRFHDHSERKIEVTRSIQKKLENAYSKQREWSMGRMIWILYEEPR